MESKNELLKKGLEIITYVALVINAVALGLSIIVDIGVPFGSVLGGYLFFIALCANIASLFFNFATLNRTDEKGKLLKRLCYIFLIFFFFALYLMLYKQFIFISQMDLTDISYLTSDILQKFTYFGILGFGLALALLDLKYLSRPETWL